MKPTDFYALAIDQGTFSTRGIVFNHHGQMLYSAQQALELKRLDKDRIEQDADALLNSVMTVVQKVLQESGIAVERIKTAGLSTQRSSIVAWRPSSGEALSPVLSWQDTRAADWLSGFSGQSELVQKKTGLRLTPHYGVSKIQWLIGSDKKVQQALQQDDCVITPLASYILFNISNNKSINIDVANASRTLLYNLLQQDWDEDLLDLFDIQKKILPRCRPIQYDYGSIKQSTIRITAVNGDQTAALFSNGRPASRALRVNLGTGAFVLTGIQPELLQSERFRSSGLLAGIASNDNATSEYYVEGTVNGAGAAIQWIQHKLQIENIRGLYPPQEYKNPAQLVFINAIGGFGSPVWRSDVDAVFIDEHNSTVEPNAQQSLVAVLESIVFLLLINIEQIILLKPAVTAIEISGGLSNVDYLCQALANLSNFNVQRSVDSEASARGICWLSLEDRHHWQRLAVEKEFIASHDAGLESRYNRFRRYLNDI